MPEHVTPGVYVEETSFRARSIEDVPTGTFGMTGLTAYGPVPYIANGATMVEPGPVLVTSFAEYERVFGGLTIGGEPCLVALAARAFFLNGGRRLYVARVFPFTTTAGSPASIDDDADFGRLDVPTPGPALLRWKARWPGSVASQIKVSVTLRRGENQLVGGELTGLEAGTAVEVVPLDSRGQPPVMSDGQDPVNANVRLVTRHADGGYGYVGADGAFEEADPQTAAFHLTLTVTVTKGEDRLDIYDELELGAEHPRSVFEVLRAEQPADRNSLVWLDTVDQDADPAPSAGNLLEALLTLRPGAFLTGGGDGTGFTSQLLLGNEGGRLGDTGDPARGLGALGEIDDIAIVATPDSVRLDATDQQLAIENLIAHCERFRFRMAIADPPADSSIGEVRAFRSKFDSTYAALYYPWLRIIDPTSSPSPGTIPPLVDIPPSGAIAGIYARNDRERGVHKAPANEVVHGITGFSADLTDRDQSVLNPEGINVLRSFEGRGNRVWGARLMSSEAEWKYIPVRRLLVHLEHSIANSIQWAVFEPNGERLWAAVREAVEGFLLGAWRTGALAGSKQEEAFFVRCDRSTMTRSDLDDGRLICLIGVATLRPAEFLTFRIAQRTAEAHSE